MSGDSTMEQQQQQSGDSAFVKARNLKTTAKCLDSFLFSVECGRDKEGDDPTNARGTKSTNNNKTNNDDKSNKETNKIHNGKKKCSNNNKNSHNNIHTSRHENDKETKPNDNKPGLENKTYQPSEDTTVATTMTTGDDFSSSTSSFSNLSMYEAYSLTSTTQAEIPSTSRPPTPTQKSRKTGTTNTRRRNSMSSTMCETMYSTNSTQVATSSRASPHLQLTNTGEALITCSSTRRTNARRRNSMSSNSTTCDMHSTVSTQAAMTSRSRRPLTKTGETAEATSSSSSSHPTGEAEADSSYPPLTCTTATRRTNRRRRNSISSFQPSLEPVAATTTSKQQSVEGQTGRRLSLEENSINHSTALTYEKEWEDIGETTTCDGSRPNGTTATSSHRTVTSTTATRRTNRRRNSMSSIQPSLEALSTTTTSKQQSVEGRAGRRLSLEEHIINHSKTLADAKEWEDIGETKTEDDPCPNGTTIISSRPTCTTATRKTSTRRRNSISSFQPSLESTATTTSKQQSVEVRAGRRLSLEEHIINHSKTLTDEKEWDDIGETETGDDSRSYGTTIISSNPNCNTATRTTRRRIDSISFFEPSLESSATTAKKQQLVEGQTGRRLSLDENSINHSTTLTDEKDWDDIGETKKGYDSRPNGTNTALAAEALKTKKDQQVEDVTVTTTTMTTTAGDDFSSYSSFSDLTLYEARGTNTTQVAIPSRSRLATPLPLTKTGDELATSSSHSPCTPTTKRTSTRRRNSVSSNSTMYEAYETRAAMPSQSQPPLTKTGEASSFSLSSFIPTCTPIMTRRTSTRRTNSISSNSTLDETNSTTNSMQAASVTTSSSSRPTCATTTRRTSTRRNSMSSFQPSRESSATTKGEIQEQTTQRRVSFQDNNCENGPATKSGDDSLPYGTTATTITVAPPPGLETEETLENACPDTISNTTPHVQSSSFSPTPAKGKARRLSISSFQSSWQSSAAVTTPKQHEKKSRRRSLDLICGVEKERYEDKNNNNGLSTPITNDIAEEAAAKALEKFRSLSVPFPAMPQQQDQKEELSTTKSEYGKRNENLWEFCKSTKTTSSSMLSHQESPSSNQQEAMSQQHPESKIRHTATMTSSDAETKPLDEQQQQHLSDYLSFWFKGKLSPKRSNRAHDNEDKSIAASRSSHRGSVSQRSAGLPPKAQ